jgi:MarR family transcriptional regulator for hemolysin
MQQPTGRDTLGLQLITVSRRYRRVMDGALSDFGLSDAGTLPLRYLVRLGHAIRQKDLAEALDIEGPTLVRALDHLMAMGLVERLEDPNDRRAKLVSATDKGRALHASFDAGLDGLRQRIFAGASETDIAAALRLLHRLETNLQRVGDAHDPAG